MLAHRTPDPAEPVEQVALHVDLTGDVGLREAELTRPEHQAAQRGGVADDDHRRPLGTGLAAVPRSQPDRQGAAEQRGDDGRHLLGDGGRGGGRARLRRRRVCAGRR